MPAPGEEPLPQSHAICIVDFSNTQRRFRFWNKWRDWGDQGYAYLPYEYFERYVFEAWVTYHRLDYRLRKVYTRKGCTEIRWEWRDEWDRRVYGREVWDEKQEERLGWVFVIERENILEIEEFYVRPEFRGRGYGRHLGEMVLELANAKKEPLRMWVPFADCKTERPSNYLPLVTMTRRLGLFYQPSPVNWAAYLATNEIPGSELPIEPTRVPPRPRCPWAAMQTSALTPANACVAPAAMLPANVAVEQRAVHIVDRGRGPQLSTSRITVQDVVPYLQQNCSWEEIREIMPVLTKEEFEVVERYVRDNFDAVMEQDGRIRERNSTRTISPEIQEIRKKGRAKAQALMEKFSHNAQGKNGDHTPG